jgi:hypothetical protein
MVTACIKICARLKTKYSVPSVVRVTGWSGQFWADYNPIFPTEIIITEQYYYYDCYYYYIIIVIIYLQKQHFCFKEIYLSTK